MAGRLSGGASVSSTVSAARRRCSNALLLSGSPASDVQAALAESPKHQRRAFHRSNLAWRADCTFSGVAQRGYDTLHGGETQ